MRVLLNECIDRRLATQLDEHDVRTVPQEGWAGIKNGELLTLAAAKYDVFVTVDLGIPFQQNVANLPIAIVLLVAGSNRLKDLRQLVPKSLNVIPQLQQGTVTTVSKDFA